MKKKSTLLLILFALLVIQHGFSQTAYRSIASGTWGDFNTWERTTNVYNPAPTWAPAISGQLPTTNNIVYIRNGHTVTLDASKNCLNLIIEAGGRLSAAATTNAIRVGAPSSGFAGTVDTLTVDGILGGVGEQMPLELPAGAASLWVRGSGTIEIGRIRANSTANLNYPGSSATNAAQGARLILDKDIKLNQAGNYAYSITNTNPNLTDSLTYTISAGRTVTLSSTGYFHNPASGVVTGGLYVYNVNGTLDLSAYTDATGGSKLIPYGNASSSLTLNVNGTLKLGAYFKADTVAASLGSLFMNINNGGLVDATLTSKLITGTIGAATATPNIFFVVSGTGSLKRTVPNDNTKIEFQLGTSTASYTPVTIHSTSGPADVYTVTLKNTFTHPAPANTLAKEWNIAEAVAGGNSDTLRFSWTTADQAASGFTGAGPVFIGRWTGTAWDYTLASVSGTGTPADPYVAKGTFASFGLFILTNTTPVPVSLVNLRVSQRQNGIQVDFGNATELNVVNYVIEKSTNGTSFTAATTLLPKTNNGSLNSYSFLDAAATEGTNFYRIKSTERNGLVKYSAVLSLRISNGMYGISISPNPVKGHTVNLQLENQEKGLYAVAIYNQVGQKIFSKQITHEGRTATFLLDLPAAVQKGMYNLQVTGTPGSRITKTIFID